MNEKQSIRLHVYMAKSGVGSRRKCESYINNGQVQVNGKTVTKQGTLITNETVQFNGHILHPLKKKVYIALNKPKGYICSNYDPKDRPLAIDLVKNAYSGRIFNVGRLDFLTSGIILFTNDGDFAEKATHPSFEIEKEYLIETKQPISESLLKQFKKGIIIEGTLYKIKSYILKNPFKANIILNEGKNREIRIFFDFSKINLTKIHRIRIGQIKMKGLKHGEYRFLSKKEIDWILTKSS